MREVGAAHLANLIGEIYDCVLQPDNWSRVLERLCTDLGLLQGVLGLYDAASGQPLMRIQHGMTREWYERMPAYAMDTTYYWGGPERVQNYPIGEVIIHSHAHPDFDPVSNRFAVEWVQPQGIQDFAAMTVAHDQTGMGTLVFTSARKLEHSQENELDLLRLLSPHVRRAITISRVLELKSYEESNLLRAAGVLPNGLAVLSATCNILYANAAAEAVFQSNNAVKIVDGRLMMRNAELAAAFSAAVSASGKEFKLSERGCGIPARGSNGARAVLYVLPLQYGKFREAFDSTAVAAVIIAKEGAQGTLPSSALRVLYDLTPAEIRVCELLLNGASASGIAEQIGVALSTVRTHLLRIFEKTATNGQADLIRRIAPLLIPLS